MKIAHLMGTGFPAAQASTLVGSQTGSLTAAGTNQATALAVTDDYNIVTTTALNTGVILPTLVKGETIVVANYGANALAVYPPVGGAISNGAANAALSVGVNKTVLLVCLDTINFVGILSA